MKTVTLGRSSREEIENRFLAAFDGEAQGAFISFETPALLFKIISGKRWELIQNMTGAGSLSIREVDRRLVSSSRKPKKRISKVTQKSLTEGLFILSGLV